MFKKMLAILTVAFLIASLAPVLAFAADISLNLDTHTANPGDEVTASGRADANNWVSIKVIDKNGNIVYLDAAKSTATGNYNFTFKIPAVEPGELTVVAGYGSTVDTGKVTVTKELLSNDASLAALTVEGPGGVLTPSFSPGINEYVVRYGEKPGGPPPITAIPNNKGANVQITPAVTLNDYTTIMVTAPDGKTTLTYTVRFVVKKDIDLSDLEAKHTIEASDVPQAIEIVPTPVGDKRVATLPEITVTGGSAPLQIPKGTKIAGPDGWDGTIQLPTKIEKPSETEYGSDVVVIAVGAGKDAAGKDIVLEFDKAVRLLIVGGKGKATAYTRDGALIKITKSLSEDSQDAADRELNEGEEAALDVGNDKVIWTKHFTEFLTYKPKVASPPSSGGPAGPPPFGGTEIKISKGGKVSEHGAMLEIPANAFSKDLRVKITKVADAEIGKLNLPESGRLASEVLEITKDKEGLFAKPVKITMAFDKSKLDNGAEMALCWYDATAGAWSKLSNNVVDLQNFTVSAETRHFTKFAVIALAPAEVSLVLTDIAGHWAESFIKTLVDKTAISGYPDQTFRPDNNITRAEYATVLVRSFPLEPQEGKGKVFTDTLSHWAKDSIATAGAYGLIAGYSDEVFGPDDPITREQMAVMITKAAKLAAGEQALFFNDSDDIADWAQSSVAAAAKAGIITGYPDGSFRPQGQATRAEAVTVIIKAIL